jgi:ParB family chromosome partitioning protein
MTAENVPAKAPEVVSALPLTSIEHGRNPRTMHELDSQKELTDSVKQHGVLQPIRVRALGEGRYAIVAGHRRYEAAKAAKLTEIPVVVAPEVADESSTYVESLVENLQREDLNPIDEAKAFQQLLDETGWSQDELGKKVGRKQSTISNALRLLGLEPEVVQAIETGTLTAAHGKAIATLPSDRQKGLAAKAVEQKMSSKAVEEAVAYEKAVAQRQADKVKERKAAIEAMLKLLGQATPEQKEKITFWFRTEDMESAAKKDGFKTGRTEWSRPSPPYKCACLGTNAYFDEWQRSASMACIDKEHAAAADEEAAALRLRGQLAAQKATDKARTAVAKHLVNAVGKLSDDGLRVVLYLVVTTNRGSYASGAATIDESAFVKRHGGTPRHRYSSDNGDVWDVCQGMSISDVLDELAKFVGQLVQPNVFLPGKSTYGFERDWRLRAYLHEQKVLVKDAVFGPDGVPERVLEPYKPAKPEKPKADPKQPVN